jgi:hypothetical protein
MSEQTTCECRNWARDGRDAFKCGDRLLVPNHHPNCDHYNDSLMDVYKVTVGGVSAYNEHLQDARDTAGDDEPEATIERVKMHREVFDNLPEFEGF